MSTGLYKYILIILLISTKIMSTMPDIGAYNIFVPNTVILSSKINDNFNTFRDYVNKAADTINTLVRHKSLIDSTFDSLKTKKFSTHIGIIDSLFGIYAEYTRGKFNNARTAVDTSDILTIITRISTPVITSDSIKVNNGILTNRLSATTGSIDTARMRTFTTSAKAGIKATTLTHDLTINGTFKATSSTVTNDTTTNLKVSGTADVFIINATALTSDTSYIGGLSIGRRLGVGTDLANFTLELDGGNTRSQIHMFNDGSGSTANDGIVMGTALSGAGFNFYDKESGGVYFYNVSTPIFALSPSGNVGVRTETPSHNLTVNGAFKATSSNTGIDTITTASYFINSAPNLYFYPTAASGAGYSGFRFNGSDNRFLSYIYGYDTGSVHGANKGDVVIANYQGSNQIILGGGYSEKVGIGTSTPTNRLTVSGSVGTDSLSISSVLYAYGLSSGIAKCTITKSNEADSSQYDSIIDVSYIIKKDYIGEEVTMVIPKVLDRNVLSNSVLLLRVPQVLRPSESGVSFPQVFEISIPNNMYDGVLVYSVPFRGFIYSICAGVLDQTITHSSTLYLLKTTARYYK